MELTPSWYTDTLQAPSRLGSRGFQNSPYGDMLNLIGPANSPMPVPPATPNSSAMNAQEDVTDGFFPGGA